MRDQIRRPVVTPLGVALVGGALWWAIGSLAFPSGFGTLVLAFGLLVAGGLYSAARRRPDAGVPVPPSARRGVRRLVVVQGRKSAAAVVEAKCHRVGKLSVVLHQLL